MSKITALLVKKLRERTGAKIIDCKEMLIKTNGNIELAIENMRKLSIITAEKKASNETYNGVIITKIQDNYGFILEVNCQTDFVTKNINFQTFVRKILNTLVDENITDIAKIKKKFEKERIDLVYNIGENINIRRIAVLKGETVGDYQHHSSRVGVLVAVNKKDINKMLIKHLAMHIAANKPIFVKPEDISSRILEEEYALQLSRAVQSGKSKTIADKIAQGRVLKFINEISLTNQLFIFDQKKTINELLKENNIDITGFIHFQVGEKY